MTSNTPPRSFIVRLFSWIWTLILFVFRAMVVVSFLVFAVTLWSGARSRVPVVEDGIALAVIPFGTISDESRIDERQMLLRQFANDTPEATPLRQIVEAIDAAAKDSRITALVLKLDQLGDAGLPQLQDIASAVQRFRAAGKPVYAQGDSFDQRQYFLAAQADEISLDPFGGVLLEGFSVYTNYFKDALDKLGVEVNIFRVGEFKSAVEPFERNDMSPEARTANQAWLGDLWAAYGHEIGSRRQLADDAADRYIAGLPAGLTRHRGDIAAYAREAGFVTHVETQAEFRERMIERVGEDEEHGTFRQIDLARYHAAVRAQIAAAGSGDREIAVVVIEGEIVDGESDSGVAGGDTIAELLDEARRDEAVQAVLLRVNSPGGSVTASEKIRRGVLALKAAGKPVVASMSSVAASGGYWVSMNADRIVADATTITGSIGIFGLLPTVAEPLNRLGIHTDGVGTTPLAGTLRIDRPLAPVLRGLIQAQIDKGYRDFIEGVAEGRKLPVEQVDTLARGRVWSGKAAKDLGLVDQLGGFAEAEAALAELAELTPDDYRLRTLEPKQDLFQQLLGDLFGARGESGDLGALLAPLAAHPATRGPAQALAELLRWADDPRGVYAYCFACVSPLGGR